MKLPYSRSEAIRRLGRNDQIVSTVTLSKPLQTVLSSIVFRQDSFSTVDLQLLRSLLKNFAFESIISHGVRSYCHTLLILIYSPILVGSWSSNQERRTNEGSVLILPRS